MRAKSFPQTHCLDVIHSRPTIQPRFYLECIHIQQTRASKPLTICHSGSSDDQSPQSTANIDAENLFSEVLRGLGSSGEADRRPSDAPGPMDQDDILKEMQMGTWRLRTAISPPLQAIAAQYEGMWRTSLSGDLGLYPIPHHFKYWDSLDRDTPADELPVAFGHNRPMPDKESPQYPRLRVENRAYESSVFRKLHLEVAHRQDGLEVLHIVLYPRPKYDLPILSLDVVSSNGRIGFAIADPCPVSMNRVLPPWYQQGVLELQKDYKINTIMSNGGRELPEWGREILSPLCISMRPQNQEEVGAFLKYAIALGHFHMQIAAMASPVSSQSAGGSHNSNKRLEQIAAAHKRYCDKQLENTKTSKVLEKAFGEEVTRQYMEQVMFDWPGVEEANTRIYGGGDKDKSV